MVLYGGGGGGGREEAEESFKNAGLKIAVFHKEGD